MNPKEILLHHLRCILTISGAKYISLFHPRLVEQSTSLSAGSGNSIDAISSADIAFCKSSNATRTSINNTIEFKPLNLTTMLIQIKETALSEPAILPIQSRDVDSSEPHKSRRTPIQTFSTDQFYFIKLVFTPKTPAWLLQADNQEDPTNKQYSALEQLLLSTGMQSKLISEFLSLLSDPLTDLCPRSVLQSKIAQLSQKHSIGLVMLHCIDFHQINKKFGHEFGDNVIREIATNLKEVTREGDILCRFGGALFGIAFPANEQTDVASLAKKLQRVLQQRQYLDGAINLVFDLGAAIVEHDESIKTAAERGTTLINRADQALKVAQQENQPSIITWHKDDFNLYQQQFNYLGGIFTADTITDYRNMLLLWDISTLIADKYNFEQLCQSVVQRLAQTFDFACAGIISNEEKSETEYKYSIDSKDNATCLCT